MGVRGNVRVSKIMCTLSKSKRTEVRDVRQLSNLVSSTLEKIVLLNLAIPLL